jgi:hypothetical protein
VVARKIAQTSLCTYAAPQYIKAHGELFKINDLMLHKCLHYLGTPHGSSWVFDDEGERVEINPNRRAIPTS